mmetsp:Transcript_142793/g.455932  ORF Transcript_142793/g.455932 Transcript_142793/m.455932 type:complete len:503 (-) Transcript_142793:9-1517(-)
MFDFDDLASEDEAAEKPSPAPAPRGATIGQLPKAKAKVKAQATPRSRPAGPDLSELAAMENAHAAKMLAMMAPPLPTAPTPVAPTNCNAMPTPPVVTAPTLSAPASHHPQYVRPPPAHADQAAIAAAAAAAFRPPVRPSEQPPAATARSDHGRGGGGSSGGAMRSEVAAYEPEEVRRAREEEEVARAVAEAAVEHEIERGRRSAWWTRLEDNRTAAPLERCGDLRINNPANDAGATNSSNPLGLPTQEFVVETKALPIRAEPSSQAPVSGAKKLGERVHACEETFDGWVKLADEPGWIPRDAHCDESLSASLRGSASGKEQLPLLPVSGLPALERALAVCLLARLPGRQMFEVVCERGVRVCREPSQDALQLGMHSCGEFVLAQSQTYHGWIRLADDEGWMPALDVLGGARLLQNVRPEELQLASPGAAGEGQVEGAGNAEAEEAARAAAAEAARREALRALEAAAMSGANTANFCAAMEVARGRGVSKKDIARCNAMRTDR